MNETAAEPENVQPRAALTDDDAANTWLSECIPPHARESIVAYTAELDDLLAHLAAYPTERWVVYRGRERVRFGSDKYNLYCDCVKAFPDRDFCIYGIDASVRSQNIDI